MNRWIINAAMLLIMGILFRGDSMVSGQPSNGFRTIPLAEDDAATDVIALTDLNFDRLVNGSSDWMIDLYSEWYEWYIHVFIMGYLLLLLLLLLLLVLVLVLVLVLLVLLLVLVLVLVVVVARLHWDPICMYSRFSS